MQSEFEISASFISVFRYGETRAINTIDVILRYTVFWRKLFSE